MNLFCGGKFSDRVSSEKLLAVSAAGPPAAFFPEIDMSGFFGHVPFWKKYDLRLDPNIHPDTLRYSQEALWRLSGGTQGALWGHLCLQGLGTVLESILC